MFHRFPNLLRRSLLGLLALSALAGCSIEAGPLSLLAPDPPGEPWVSEVGRDHELSGRIWSPAEKRFVPARTLVNALSAARFALLGEKHDNADHHRIQAWLIDRLSARGRNPAAAFEMLNGAQESALADYLATEPDEAAGLGDALGWNESGWPAWDIYAPVFQAALDGDMPILPANLRRSTIQAVAKEGVAALGPERVAALGLDVPLPRELRAAMGAEITESHCNELPATMIRPMINAMVARDAAMADVLIQGAARPGRDSAILITGTGHTRKDHGVPYHLQRLAPAQSAVSLALVEVDEGITDPAAYATIYDAEGLPFDFVWFTPRVDNDDPCSKFKEQLRRAKKRHQDDN